MKDFRIISEFRIFRLTRNAELSSQIMPYISTDKQTKNVELQDYS